jgi:hypothetical protein
MDIKFTDDPELFREYLAIDKDDLDTMLEMHAELYYHASKSHADAVGRRDEARLDYEDAEAEA